MKTTPLARRAFRCNRASVRSTSIALLIRTIPAMLVPSLLPGTTPQEVFEAIEAEVSSVFYLGSWQRTEEASHDGSDSLTNTSLDELTFLDLDFEQRGILSYWIKKDDGPWEHRTHSTQNGRFRIGLNYLEDPNHRIWIDEMAFQPADGGSFQSEPVWGGSIEFSPDLDYFDASLKYVDATFTPDPGFALVGLEGRTPVVQSIGWIDGYRETPTTLALQVFWDSHRPLSVFGQRVELGVVSQSIPDLFIVPTERSEARFRKSSADFRSAPESLFMEEDHMLADCRIVAFVEGPGILTYFYRQAKDAPGDWRVHTQFFGEEGLNRFEIPHSTVSFTYRGTSEPLWIDDLEFHPGVNQILEISTKGGRHAAFHGGGTVSVHLAEENGLTLVENEVVALKRGSELILQAHPEPSQSFAFWSTAADGSSGDHINYILPGGERWDATSLVASYSDPRILPVFHPNVSFDEGPSRIQWASDGLTHREGYGFPGILSYKFFWNPWQTYASYSHDGDGSLVGWIDDSTEWSHLLARLKGPGLLRFWWAMPNPGYGTLELYHNGSHALSFKPPTEWTEAIIPIGEENTGLVWALKSWTVFEGGPAFLDDFAFEEDSFFDGLTEVSDGWMHLEWFGRSAFVHWPWLYHENHGWTYVSPRREPGLALYDWSLGEWIWTSPDYYPLLYLYGPRAGWYVYGGGSVPDRWFYSFANATWTIESSLRSVTER